MSLQSSLSGGLGVGDSSVLRIKTEPDCEDVATRRCQASSSSQKRLDQLRQLWSRLVEELCLLEHAGSLADVPDWSVAPFSEQLRVCRERWPLEASEEFVKLPAVAVSDPLPESKPVPGRLPPPPDSQPATSTAATGNTGRPPAAPLPVPPAEQVDGVEWVRQEAEVGRRVLELRLQGLWSERRLPRVAEPPRRRTHWDYVLEEMQWMAADFRQERRWKQAAAARCASAVRRHLQQRRQAAQHAAQRQQAQLRGIAAFAAAEVQKFWRGVRCLADVKASFVTEYSLFRALRHVVAAEQRVNRHGLLECVRQLHADARLELPQLLDTLPAGYLQERRSNLSSAESLHDSSSDSPSSPEHCDVDPASTIPVAELARSSECSDSEGELEDMPSDDGVSTGECVVAAAGVDMTCLLADSCDQEEVRAVLERQCERARSLLPSQCCTPATDSAAAESPLLRGSLRPYQQVGRHWLRQLRRHGLHALLADEAGLGRRVQTVALWASLAAEDADWGPHLVLAPRAALLQWRAVCLRWCPALRLHMLPDDCPRQRSSLPRSDEKPAHVWLVSFSAASARRLLLTRRRWRSLVVDSATSLTVDSDCGFVLDIGAEQRVLLCDVTAGGDVRRLWMTAALLLGAGSRSVEQLRQRMSRTDGQLPADELLARLDKLVQCYRLARRCDQLSDQMPTVSDNVILCPLQPLQRVLYDRLISSRHVQRALSSGSFVDVMTAVKQLRCVCNHPQLAAQATESTPLWLPPLTLSLPTCCSPCQRPLSAALVPCHVTGSSWAAARCLSLAANRLQLAGDCGGEFDVLAALLGACTSAAVSSAGGAAGQTLSRMASLTVPATVPQSRPTPAGPSPALVNSTAAPRTQSPPPTPPPSPGPPTRNEASAALPSQFNCLPPSDSADRVRALSEINRHRCETAPVYGSDLLSVVTGLPRWAPWNQVVVPAAGSSIDTSVKVPTLSEPVPLRLVVSELVMFRPRAIAARPILLLSNRVSGLHCFLPLPAIDRRLRAMAAARVLPPPPARPLPRDCGKLRLLEQLLRQLHAAQRRVLLLAQMESVLDLLQRFVTAAGYSLVRVDASVPAHRRHALCQRFNGDARLFCALLSTRTPAGPACELAADTVIVYDADWSPCAEALTQRRCQRMACSRPLHIYRLVSEATVESHLLQHVDETRLVRDIVVGSAPRGPAGWRYGAVTLRDLFGAGSVPVVTGADHADWGPPGAVQPAVFEDALAATVEDERDALALYTVRASQTALADQQDWPDSAPGQDGSSPSVRRLRRAMESEYDRFVAELSDLQYWALDVVEDQALSADRRSIAAPTANSASSKKSSAALLEGTASEQQTETQASSPPDSWRALELGFEPLTYPSDEQMWLSDGSSLPLWCPPTPPREEEPDQCVSPQLSHVYHDACMTDAQLPPIYVRREAPRRKPPQPVPLAPSSAAAAHPPATGEAATAAAAARAKPSKVRRDDSTSVAPRSLFNRVPSSVLRMRRELHLQQRHTLFSSGSAAFGKGGGGATGPGAGSSQLLAKSALLEYSTGDWLVHEDWSLLQALRSVLDLPLSLLAASPAHVVNWELVCELVNRASRAFRSAKFCRMRYDSVVQPREEGKMLLSSPVKKSKKHKQQQQQMMTAGGAASGAGVPGSLPHAQKPIRPLRTSQMMLHDKNQAFSQLMLQRFDNIKMIASKRAPTTRPPLAAMGFGQQRSPRQAPVLAEAGVDYEAPLAPAQVAANRVLRLAKEKQRLSAAAAGGSEQITRLHKPGAATSAGAAAPPQAVRLQAASVGAAVRPGGAHVAVQGATIVSVANLTPVQVAQRLVSAAAATATPSGVATLKQPATIQTLTQKTLTPSQLQALKQQTVLRHKLALSTASVAAGAASTAAASTFNSPASAGHKLQVEVSLGAASSGSTVAPIATVPNSTGQRTQVRILKQPMGKHMVAARTMTESEVAVILKQRPQLAAGVQSALVPQLLAQVQGAAPTSVTISVPRPATAGATKAGPLAAPTRPLLAQSLRKMTGTTAVTGGAGVSAPAVVGGAKRLPAQLSTVQLVQAGSMQKQLPGTVTVQQLQPMLGRVQTTGRLAGAGSSPRQTIQVVSAPAVSTGAAGRQPVALTQLRPLLYTASSSSAAVLVPRVQQVAAGAAGVTRLRTAVHTPTVVTSNVSQPQQQQQQQTQPGPGSTQSAVTSTVQVQPASASTAQLQCTASSVTQIQAGATTSAAPSANSDVTPTTET